MERTPLMEAFDFYEEDLVANRSGVVSQGQLDRMKKRQGWIVSGSIVAAMALLLGAMGLFAIGGSLILAIVMLALSVGFFIYASYSAQKTPGRTLKHIQGKIVCEKEWEHSHDIEVAGRELYFVKVNKTRFQVNISQFAGVPDDITMATVYYDPVYRKIISIDVHSRGDQPVPEAKPSRRRKKSQPVE
jgi:hypothetical protein